MKRHAEIICASGGDVLNVGFGMGIIDGFIGQHKVRSLPQNQCTLHSSPSHDNLRDSLSIMSADTLAHYYRSAC